MALNKKMVKYIRVTNFGKGFITHEDQNVNGLRFSCKNDLTKITGDENKITEWTIRVGGTEVVEKTYLLEIAQYEKTDAENRLVYLNAEIIKETIVKDEKSKYIDSFFTK